MRQRGGPLDEASIGWVCRNALRGLEYMHSVVRAIHRDVKAANLLVTHRAQVKLADLGVAPHLRREL